MSTKAEAILEEIASLPPEDQREVWEKLGGRMERTSREPVVYGEPLTDEDIGEAARVTFSMLDGEEKRAETR